MKQFTHEQAENFAASMMTDFPALKVDRVLDVRNADTGGYERSFFSVYLMTKDNDILFHTYIGSEAEFNGMLTFCQYIASAIADNQQSEEHEIIGLRLPDLLI